MNLDNSWNENKAAENLRKHGVSFGWAVTMLCDAVAVIIPDPEHSDSEERWITIGYTPSGECLFWLTPGEDTGANSAAVRIISALPATKTERKWYEEP